MPSFGALGKFFGRTVSEGAAYAAGVATGPVLAPEVELIRQQAWQRVKTRALDAETAAGIVAEDVAKLPWGENEASLTGVDEDRFRRLVDETLNGPGVGELLRILRRRPDRYSTFQHGLRKAKLENIWDGYIADLANEKLSPQQIALGIVRSVIADPGLLVKTLDTSDSNVPKYKPADVDALTEAAAAGIDRERLRAMVGEIGLPMSAQQAASAYFRGIITLGAFNQAILEGDTRPEWADKILEQSRVILTPHAYAELHLRGWISEQEMRNGAAKTGMTEEDADRTFLNLGRPLVTHQITTGLARGGTYGGGYESIPEPYQTAIRQSAIRPEWADLDYANRYTYPSAFVIRSLVQSGDWSAATGLDVLKKIGWDPELAATTITAWTAGGGGASKESTVTDLVTLYEAGKATRAATISALEDLGYAPADAGAKLDVFDARRVTGEETRVVTAAHKAFIDGSLTDSEARTLLGDLRVQPWAVDAILNVWTIQKTAGV